jgi:VanZ family protein
MSLLDRLPRPLILAAFWIATIGVGVLALLPASVPMPTTGWDKANHGLAFFTLGLLGAVAWPRSAARVWVALAIYGGAIEIAQALTPTRDGEWLDWCADMVGIGLVALAWRWSARRRPADR